MILYAGFKAPAGSRFIAYLEPCSSTMYKGNGADHVTMSDAERGIKTPIVPISKQSPVVENTNASNEISISPNPFKSNFTLTINSKEEQKGRVAIFNSIGIKMQEKASINISKGFNKISFDGSALAEGVYMVEITMGDTKTVRKIMKM